MLFIAFAGCKKKTETLRYESVLNDDEIYGGFSSGLVIRGASGSTDTCTLGFSTSFYASYPNNSLKSPPQIDYVIYNNKLLESFTGFPGYFTLQADISNPLAEFKAMRVVFNSVSLGGQNSFIETTNSLPQFSQSFGDTLTLSKTTVTSFTVVNNNANYKAQVLRATTDPLVFYSQDLQLGENIIKIDPVTISPDANEVLLHFDQNKFIYLKGKRYMFNRQYQRNYPVKWIN
jgi:hypothetical protein